MIHKIITSMILFGVSATAMFIPSHAEALKLKIEPSITFHQSHTKHHHKSRPQQPKVIVPSRPAVYYYAPYEEVVYYELEPAYYYYYTYPEYYYPSNTRSSGVDYQLKFKLK